MTPLTKAVTRITDTVSRGRTLVAKMSPEGVYIKGAGERWSSAYLVPWAAAYDLGARLKARAVREELATRRRQRRMQ